ncbi:MAG: branched-chain amino acid ABC transporter ATP-binding protein/permease [Firmicutes bacterium]|nr:branched-chain amino acid ABC transporter ATP-binding protein/permease [Bacillota bacterium]
MRDKMQRHPNQLKGSLYWIAASAVGLLILNYLVATDALDWYYAGVLSTAGIYIILTTSLNLINGITGQLSIGHAGFMAVGAYTAALLSVHYDTPFVVNILAAFATAAVAGLVIGLPTLRLKGDYLAIATLGFGEIIRVVIQNLKVTRGAFGIVGITWVDNLFYTEIVVLLSVVIIWRIVNSATGRALIAIREDETAAETMGINTTLYKVMAFAIGSAFAGVAGALYAHRMTYISPNDFTFLKSVDILVMLVLGGLGSITGAVVSAFSLTLLPEFLRFIDEWRMVIYPLLLVVVMLFRPQGLFGTKEIDFGALGAAFRWLKSRFGGAVGSAPQRTVETASPSSGMQTEVQTSSLQPAGVQPDLSGQPGSAAVAPAEPSSRPFLEVNGLSIYYGGLKAVSDFNMSLPEGALHGLIGPNGAGKTTVFNMLTGLHPPSEGEIRFRRKRIDRLPPYRISSEGVARTFQNIRLFKDLTVLDNVKTAFHMNVGYGFGASLVRPPSYGVKERRVTSEAERLLEILGLQERRMELARNLPYGEQRRLEIARALATRPRLLLLDEPAAGMNPQETASLMELIRWIRDEFALTILLIEHDMSLVMRLCERITVLDYGVTIFEGTPDEVKRNPRVIEAYLGQEAN